ncbi:MAG: hypothetical protein A2V88_13205 [Elusimicrobia bacterium RBG_16_66_12]|nr:MAG: hypothetical protein A2V88_13205 [Elusimicrobia bacterium RBG_16_66_12]
MADGFVERMTLSRDRLAAGLRWSVASKIIQVALNYGGGLAVGRMLGPSALGGAHAFFTVLGVLRALHLPGAGRAATYVAAGGGDAAAVRRSAMPLQAGLALASGATLAVLAAPMAAALHDPDLKRCLYLAVPLPLILGLVPLYLQPLAGFQQFKDHAHAGLAGAVAAFVALLAALAAGLGLAAVPLSLLAGAAAGIALAAARLPAPAPAAPSPAGTDFARFALWATVLELGLVALNRSGVLWTKRLIADPAHAGLWVSALGALKLLHLPWLALTVAMFPRLAAAARTKDVALLRELLHGLGQGLCVVMAPAALLTALLAPSVVGLLWGGSFAAAAPALAVAAPGFVFSCAFQVLAAAWNASGRPEKPARLAVLLVLANAVLHAWAVPRWGVMAAAWIYTWTWLAGGLLAARGCATALGLERRTLLGEFWTRRADPRPLLGLFGVNG